MIHVAQKAFRLHHTISVNILTDYSVNILIYTNFPRIPEMKTAVEFGKRQSFQ